MNVRFPEELSPLFVSLFQNSETAFLIFDRNGVVISLNLAAERFLGRTSAAVSGKNLESLLGIHEFRIENIESITDSSQNIVIEDASGQAVPSVLRILAAMQGPASFFLAQLTPSNEHSSRSDTQHQRLEALGVLAGNVAHDLNNILTSILGHVSYMRLALADVPAEKGSLSAIEDGARRAASITQKILDFTRGHENQVLPVNLSSVTQAAVNLLRSSIPSSISLDLRLPHTDIYVLGDEGQLSRVLMNLTVNARDALPNGGRIVVELNTASLYAHELCQQFSIEPGEFAVLRISDNGHGIPAALKQKIFEPFFTTKSSQGTGLGLAIVNSIVKSLRGAVSVESDEGKGTVFQILFPLCVDLLQGEETLLSDEEESLPGGTEKILIVDDEEAVRMIVERSLEHLGYQVVVAKDGLEALEIYKQHASTFQLVIIDMIMPKMSGDELFQQLKLLDPHVPVLIASGYSSDARTRLILDNGGLGFIQKPFAVEELAREVRRCLDLPENTHKKAG